MALVPWTKPATEMEIYRSPEEPWTADEWWTEDWENKTTEAEQPSTFRVRLWPKQLLFFQSDETFAALVGGIGSGKSHAGVAWEIYRRLAFPGSLGLVVGPTRLRLKQTTLRKYMELLDPIRAQVVAKWNIADLHMTFKNGSEVFFWGADDEGTVQRMRGLELADFYIDEAALVPAAVMDVLPGRLRQKNRRGVAYPFRGRMTTTHDGEDWIYERFEPDDPRQKPIGAIWHTSIYDNEDLPPEYIRTVEALFGDTEYAKQELLGLHAKYSGLMYPKFDMTTHVTDEPIEKLAKTFKRVVFGFDWGFHFGPVIAAGITDDDQVVIAAEYYGQRVTLDQQIGIAPDASGEKNGALGLCRLLGVRPDRVDCFADPSRPENIVTLVQKGMGLSCPEYERGHITEGALEVQRLLRVREDGKPGLVIHRSCVWTLKEIRAYKRKEVPGKAQNDPTRFSEEPAPGQLDHAMDAVRYFVMGLRQGGFAQNAISYMLTSNPACDACGRRFNFPLSQAKANCPHCGRERVR
jgi:phage terminase large subunit